MCVVVWADKALKPNNESVGAATAPRKMVKNGKKVLAGCRFLWLLLNAECY